MNSSVGSERSSENKQNHYLRYVLSKNNRATRSIGQSRTLHKPGKLHHMLTFE